MSQTSQMPPIQQRIHDALVLVLENAKDSGDAKQQDEALERARKHSFNVELTAQMRTALYDLGMGGRTDEVRLKAIKTITKYATDNGIYDGVRLAAIQTLEQVLEKEQNNVPVRGVAVDGLSAIVMMYPNLATADVKKAATSRLDVIPLDSLSLFHDIFSRAAIKNLEAAEKDAKQNKQPPVTLD